MRSTEKRPPIKKRWIIIILLLVIVNFYQFPYYFTKPGDAKILNAVIEVENGYKDEGTFMLTTVRMGKANAITYVWAKLSDARELIHEDFIRRGGETDEEYHHRQLMMMSSSQDIATIVAYNQAGKEAFYKNHGVIVTGAISQMPAYNQLLLGDIIVGVDGTEIKTVDELLLKLEGKQKDDPVILTIIRDDLEKDVDLVVASFPEEIDETGERVGIGITSPVTKRELIVNPNIEIDTNTIGGPSAGLMFALEIYNQLNEMDITKGHHIAGTGSINEDGEVGRIGGVKQKVITAERVGADFFFAPNEFGAAESNYLEALETANAINAKMKIVPIDTFEEALTFLEGLESKY